MPLVKEIIKFAIESLVFQNRLLNGAHSIWDIKFPWHPCRLFYIYIGSKSYCFLFITPGTHDINWTYVRRSENVFWTSYVRSIYVRCPGVICLSDLGGFIFYMPMEVLMKTVLYIYFWTGIYLFKFNNWNARSMCETS